MTRRHLILRVSATVITVAAVGASGASAMPARDAHSRAAAHTNAALRDAAAHADTMRRIGARRAPRACR